MENNGGILTMAQGSIHYGGDATAIYNFTEGNTVTNFHTYTVDWTTNAILFYVDGHLYETQTSWSSSAGAYPFPFNQPFFFYHESGRSAGVTLAIPPPPPSITAPFFPAKCSWIIVRIYAVTDPFRITVASIEHQHRFELAEQHRLLSANAVQRPGFQLV